MLQCLSSYELMDMDFFGPFLTLSKGSLKKHIDRVVANKSWQVAFLNSKVIHLALPAYDHRGL